MKYTEFRDAIMNELAKNPSGLTWTELRDRLSLPYSRPCPTWVSRLEIEIGLNRKEDPSLKGRPKRWSLK